MRRSDPYALHRPFVARAAMGRNGVGLVLLVFIGFEIVFNAMPYLLPADILFPEPGPDGTAPDISPVDTFWEFGIFIVPCLALILLVRAVHRRGFWSLVGDRATAINDAKAAFLWTTAIIALMQVVWIVDDYAQFSEVRPLDRWLLWLIPGMLALIVQVGTEELYFRGYLQQQFALFSRSRLVWMGLPSVLFGVAHLVNSADPVEGLSWAIWAGMLGYACADLTARTGTIGAAVGLHLANNAVVLFLVATKGWPGSGMALFLYPYQPFDGTWGTSSADSPGFLVGEIIGSAMNVWIMWMAARVAVRR